MLFLEIFETWPFLGEIGPFWGTLGPKSPLFAAISPPVSAPKRYVCMYVCIITYKLIGPFYAKIKNFGFFLCTIKFRLHVPNVPYKNTRAVLYILCVFLSMSIFLCIKVSTFQNANVVPISTLIPSPVPSPVPSRSGKYQNSKHLSTRFRL